MPTGRTSDLVPLRKPTKRRLAAIKGDATYDEAIRALLDAAPPDAVRARLRNATATPPPARPAPASAWREPEKQRLMAQLAAESWRAWRRSGRARDLGPRMVAWRVDEPRSGGGVRVVARPGRGLAA